MSAFFDPGVGQDGPGDGIRLSGLFMVHLFDFPRQVSSLFAIPVWADGLQVILVVSAIRRDSRLPPFHRRALPGRARIKISIRDFPEDFLQPAHRVADPGDRALVHDEAAGCALAGRLHPLLRHESIFGIHGGRDNPSGRPFFSTKSATLSAGFSPRSHTFIADEHHVRELVRQFGQGGDGGAARRAPVAPRTRPHKFVPARCRTRPRTLILWMPSVRVRKNQRTGSRRLLAEPGEMAWTSEGRSASGIRSKDKVFSWAIPAGGGRISDRSIKLDNPTTNQADAAVPLSAFSCGLRIEAATAILKHAAHPHTRRRGARLAGGGFSIFYGTG
jgi:hypothetical protein